MTKHQILPTFLVVEDSLLDFELMKSAIMECGKSYPLVHLENGVDLLEYLEKWTPDQHEIAAIFLDLKMPVMNGLEALEHIKQQEYTRRIPVIMISASNYPTDIEKAYDLGANAYMLKEMSIVDFNNSVNYLVGFWGEFNQRLSSIKEAR